MPGKRVLISGAGIAGPALAYWLNRYGYAVTVVERAKTLRPGGQAVDFKGAAHLGVLDRMGILEAVRRRQTGKTDMTIVDDGGRRLATIPGELSGGDIEIARGDLAMLLHDKTAAHCRYVFGDSIASLTETADSVAVTFEHGAPRTFDLVVGADGIHSNVRRLAFGEEERFVRFMKYYYATCGAARTADSGYPDGRAVALLYNVPGRLVSLGGPKAATFFLFAAGQCGWDRHDVDTQKGVLARAYEGVGWRVPEAIADMWASQDFHFDSLSRVEMDHYSRGRTVLLGDAAYGNALGGFGTGLSIVGAYVLAGELATTGGDHRLAFTRYEKLLHQYAKIGRSGNPGAFLAPTTRTRIWARNAVFGNRGLSRLMLRISQEYATIPLPRYDTHPHRTVATWQTVVKPPKAGISDPCGRS